MISSEKIKEEAARFPKEFGLRAFPGKKFKINISASYEWNDKVTLYTYVWAEEEERWMAFAKGTVKELMQEVVEL